MQKVKSFLENKILSIIITLLFAVFNLVFGIIKNYAFGVSIAVYYFLFSAIKISLSAVSEKAENQRPQLVAISAGLFVLNVALVAPISLMVMWKRTFCLGIIPAITVATYTVYKIASSIVNYTKARHSENKIETIGKSANLIDAVVSLLLLQNTLLLSQNSELPYDMYVLSICTSAAAYVVTIIISALTLSRVTKKAPQNEAL